MRKILVAVAIVIGLGVGLAALQVPVPKEIPGVNFKDPWPNGCADCHNKATGKEAKMAVLLANVSPELKAAAQVVLKTAGGDPAKITGKHPDVKAVVAKGYPGDPEKKEACFQCHNPGTAKTIPQLDRMLYLLKYGNFDGKDKFTTPATKPEFVTKYGAWCTACHAFEVSGGAMTSKIVLKQGKE